MQTFEIRSDSLLDKRKSARESVSLAKFGDTFAELGNFRSSTSDRLQTHGTSMGSGQRGESVTDTYQRVVLKSIWVRRNCTARRAYMSNNGMKGTTKTYSRVHPKSHTAVTVDTFPRRNRTLQRQHVDLDMTCLLLMSTDSTTGYTGNRRANLHEKS